jgi:hypothetical protein
MAGVEVEHAASGAVDVPGGPGRCFGVEVWVGVDSGPGVDTRGAVDVPGRVEGRGAVDLASWR